MADTVIGLTFEPKVIRSKKTGKAQEDKPKEEKVTADEPKEDRTEQAVVLWYMQVKNST